MFKRIACAIAAASALACSATDTTEITPNGIAGSYSLIDSTDGAGNWLPAKGGSLVMRADYTCELTMPTSTGGVRHTEQEWLLTPVEGNGKVLANVAQFNDTSATNAPAWFVFTVAGYRALDGNVPPRGDLVASVGGAFGPTLYSFARQ